jgi:hypothetical protein
MPLWLNVVVTVAGVVIGTGLVTYVINRANQD